MGRGPPPASAFATDHVEGTIGIELADPFSTYLGWLIPWGTALTLLAETAEQITEAQRQLVRIGIDRPPARPTEPDAWAGEQRRRTYDVVDFTEVADRLAEDGTCVLDVRRDDEWDEGHIADAIHLPMHELVERSTEVPAAGRSSTAPAGSGPASPPASSTGPATTSCSSTTTTTNAEGAGLEIVHPPDDHPAKADE